MYKNISLTIDKCPVVYYIIGITNEEADKMKLHYTQEKDSMDSKPKVCISCDTDHLGSIWGTVYAPKDKFSKDHHIIYIKNRHKDIVAVLWNAYPKEVTPVAKA